MKSMTETRNNSNMKGLFVCVLAAISLISSANAFAQEKSERDTMRKTDLKEIVVKAKNIRHEGMKDILYLGRDNRNFGSNALDAISSLPYFKTEIGLKTLSTIDMEDVFILINGIPSDGDGLRSYQGDEIQKVEFYQVAPAEYMMYTKGPVANIIIKRPKRRMYSAYLSSIDDPIDFYTGDNINFTYADSLNQVKLNYYLSVSDKNNNKNSNNINYQDGSFSGYRSTDSRSKGNSHTLSASYQRFQGRSLFNVEAGYYWNPYSRNTTDGIATYRSPSGAEHTGKGGTYLNNRDRRGYVNLYYAYSIDPASKIAFNVVNTWGRAKAYNRIWREFQNLPELDYDIENRTDNRTYSLMASTYFYKATPRSGMFSAGVNWTYTRLNQENDGIRNIPVTNNGVLYAGWQRTWSFFTFMPTAGLSLYMQNDGSGRSTYAIPYIQLAMRATGRGKTAGLVGNLSLRMGQNTPNVSNLALNATNITDKLVAIGNPALRRSIWWMAILNAKYVFGNSSVISFNYKPTFIRHAMMPVLFQNGDITYIQSQNGSNSFENSVSLFTDLRIFKWLSFSPSVSYRHINYHTPTQHVNKGRWSYSAGLDFFLGEWTIAAFSNIHWKGFDGDFINRGAGQHGGLVDWKHKNLSIQARYNYFHHANRSQSASLNNFTYRSVNDVSRHTITLMLTYYFSHGKTRSHENKLINNMDTNTGLSDYNTFKR